MSSYNVVLKKREALICCDAASYTGDGILRSIVQKAFVLPTLNLVMSSMGIGGAAAVFASELSRLFTSFDDLILGIELAMPKLIEQYADDFIAGHEQTNFSLFFVGWSESRRRPEGYRISYCDPGEVEYWRSTSSKAEPLTLYPLRGLTWNPALKVSDLRAAGVDCDGSEEEILERFTDVEMLTILELDRRRSVPLRPGLEPHHWCGGLALISQITQQHGITQRVMHRWPDKIGEVISPEPITDWPAWRARFIANNARSAPPAPAVLMPAARAPAPVVPIWQPPAAAWEPPAPSRAERRGARS